MSSIPSSAMPHAYTHEDEADEAGSEIKAAMPSTGVLIGGAVLAYVLYRVLR
ncbi:hypothetical protein ACWPM1_01255 [Tsuneonella sp. HG249]|jgi:hypothetical protein